MQQPFVLSHAELLALKDLQLLFQKHGKEAMSYGWAAIHNQYEEEQKDVTCDDRGRHQNSSIVRRTSMMIEDRDRCRNEEKQNAYKNCKNPYLLHQIDNKFEYEQDLKQRDRFRVPPTPTASPDLSPPYYFRNLSFKTSSPSPPPSPYLGSSTSVQHLNSISTGGNNVSLRKSPLYPETSSDIASHTSNSEPTTEKNPRTCSSFISSKRSPLKLPPITQVIPRTSAEKTLLSPLFPELQFREESKNSLGSNSVTMNNSNAHSFPIRRAPYNFNTVHERTRLRLPPIADLMAGIPGYAKNSQNNTNTQSHSLPTNSPGIYLQPQRFPSEQTHRRPSPRSFTPHPHITLSQANENSNITNRPAPSPTSNSPRSPNISDPDLEITHSYVPRSATGSSEVDKRARKALQQQYRRKYGPTREARERFTREEDSWLLNEKSTLEGEPNKHWIDLEMAHKARFPDKSFRTLSGLQSRYYRIRKRTDEPSSVDDDILPTPTTLSTYCEQQRSSSSFNALVEESDMDGQMELDEDILGIGESDHSFR